MRTLLLSRGLQMLNEQYGQAYRLMVTGFVAGKRKVTRAEIEAWDENEPSIPAMQGQVVLKADHTFISWIPTQPDEVKLTCYIPESVPEIEIGNITILAGTTSGSTIDVPFCLSGTDASTIKIQTTRTSPGYNYYFDLMFRLPELMDRFTFDNLDQRVPEWLRVGSEQDLPRPEEDGHDQFIIDVHSEYGGVHPIINSQNKHYGCPLMQPLNEDSPPTQWIISGGRRGDGYYRDRD